MSVERVDTIRERLAAIEHERWSSWQRYVHQRAARQRDGSLVLMPDDVERWERQIATPYEHLSEAEKDSDRREVERIAWLLDAYGQVEAERDALRALAGFALEVLAVGGNGEGWTLNDAVTALRIGLGVDGIGNGWLGPVSDEDRARVRSFVGELASLAADSGTPPATNDEEAT